MLQVPFASVSQACSLTFCPAGQPKFRSMWERYCNGVDAIVCVDQFPLSITILTIEKISSRLHRREEYLSREWYLLTSALQKDKFKTASFELHQLLGQFTLTGVPLLVVCNFKKTQRILFFICVSSATRTTWTEVFLLTTSSDFCASPFRI